MNKQALAANLVYGRFGLTSLFVQDVSNNDFGTFSCKQLGFCGTHASGSTTDQGHLVLQPHLALPRS